MDEFHLAASSIPPATFHYLASPEWIPAAENICLIGPAGTGKSHMLLALGEAAVQAGYRVKYFTAADLVDTLYRGLADNSVGRVITNLLRNDAVLLDELGFAPLDDTGAQLLFRFVAAAYERRSLGLASHWPFEQWGRFMPEHHRRQLLTGSSTTATSPSPTATATECDKPRRTEEPHSRTDQNRTKTGDFYLATTGTKTWPLTEGAGVAA